MQSGTRIIENKGNSEYGTIYLIKQRHKADPQTLEELDVPQLTQDQRRSIALYQGRILQELFDRDLKDVFSEAITEDLSFDQFMGSIFNESIKSQFPDGVPNNPSDGQVDLLYGFGGANLYSILREGITIHQTEIFGGLEQRTNEDRELDTIAVLKAYFDENLGSEVPLVYGRAHDFRPYINASFNPRIESVEFPIDEKQGISLRSILASTTNFLRKK